MVLRFCKNHKKKQVIANEQNKLYLHYNCIYLYTVWTPSIVGNSELTGCLFLQTLKINQQLQQYTITLCEVSAIAGLENSS